MEENFSKFQKIDNINCKNIFVTLKKKLLEMIKDKDTIF